MANNWVVADCTNALAFDFAGTSVPATAPITLGLDTVAGSSTVVGTEVVGGTYARQPYGASFAVPQQVSNAAIVNFTGMPAIPSPGVTGLTLRDSATTPVAKWRGLLGAAKTTNAGDTLTFAAGAVVASVA